MCASSDSGTRSVAADAEKTGSEREDEARGRERELRVRVHATISHWKKGTRSGENAREAAGSTASARHVFREGKYSTAPLRTCWASSSAFGITSCGGSVSSSMILEH